MARFQVECFREHGSTSSLASVEKVGHSLNQAYATRRLKSEAEEARAMLETANKKDEALRELAKTDEDLAALREP